MNFLALPTGAGHGWGIVGMGIAREMARLTPGRVRLVTQAFTADSVGDELVYRELAALLPKPGEFAAARVANGITHLPGPLLTCAASRDFASLSPALRGSLTIGHAVFEENVLHPAWLENGRRNYDFIATASTWCTRVLEGYGVKDARTVIQGIDPRIFFPLPADLADSAREFFRDQFVIFSGGKFEYRKAQDVVIRAVKVMQDRHPDVVLINAWHNAWPQSFETMRQSPHLAWPGVSGPYADVMVKILAHNGLDVARVITLGPRTNALMPRIYRNSDVGLFPNRCEGGTNLVMMEYMACGKPVVATAACGHADVIKPEYAWVVASPKEVTISNAQGPTAHWPEPDLDDTIDKLEYAYSHRAELASRGAAGAAAMLNFTWGKTAAEFLKLMQPA